MAVEVGAAGAGASSRAGRDGRGADDVLLDLHADGVAGVDVYGSCAPGARANGCAVWTGAGAPQQGSAACVDPSSHRLSKPAAPIASTRPSAAAQLPPAPAPARAPAAVATSAQRAQQPAHAHSLPLTRTGMLRSLAPARFAPATTFRQPPPRPAAAVGAADRRARAAGPCHTNGPSLVRPSIGAHGAAPEKSAGEVPARTTPACVPEASPSLPAPPAVGGPSLWLAARLERWATAAQAQELSASAVSAKRRQCIAAAGARAALDGGAHAGAAALPHDEPGRPPAQLQLDGVGSAPARAPVVASGRESLPGPAGGCAGAAPAPARKRPAALVSSAACAAELAKRPCVDVVRPAAATSAACPLLQMRALEAHAAPARAHAPHGSMSPCALTASAAAAGDSLWRADGARESRVAYAQGQNGGTPSLPLLLAPLAPSMPAAVNADALAPLAEARPGAERDLVARVGASALSRWPSHGSASSALTAAARSAADARARARQAGAEALSAPPPAMRVRTTNPFVRPQQH
ncbi:hypothetical protein KFE25_014023 [Diacronema lutheri]|uniref:Uncharacterized protein n=1 Tax=Diacronema lutheri TaxID=2081491 RepID=A0A8J5XK73_DIALT|nr:hypothetical protein KFE25_014023 [Diacronema lutheri]